MELCRTLKAALAAFIPAPAVGMSVLAIFCFPVSNSLAVVIMPPLRLRRSGGGTHFDTYVTAWCLGCCQTRLGLDFHGPPFEFFVRSGEFEPSTAVNAGF
jgi:hypothetical protein